MTCLELIKHPKKAGTLSVPEQISPQVGVRRAMSGPIAESLGTLSACDESEVLLWLIRASGVCGAHEEQFHQEICWRRS